MVFYYILKNNKWVPVNSICKNLWWLNKKFGVQSPPIIKTNWCLGLLIKSKIVEADVIDWNSIKKFKKKKLEKLYFTTLNYTPDYTLHPQLLECMFCTLKLEFLLHFALQR